MKKLEDIISHIEIIQFTGNKNTLISELILDSRKAAENTAFFAIQGTQSDGHSFIPAVIEKGCSVIFCSILPEILLEKITYVLVKDTADAVGKTASAFYDFPSEKLEIAAVTGTNGKTTVATLLYGLFRTLGYKTGLVSTVENLIDGKSIPATHTTPDAISLQKLLSEMVAQGCTHCFMEASSHAIEQKRISGLKLAGAVFTNLSHDHLDYHKTFDNYLKAKKKLFDQLSRDAFALVNRDDRNGLVMVQNCKATKYTYALKSMADFKAKIIEQDFSGMYLELAGIEAWYLLTGEFNAYNLTAVYATAFLMGIPVENLVRALTTLKSVSGRFEYYTSKNGIIGVVDYAHTPDALKNVIETINQIRTKNENLITVIGCGGNRDREKRPKMAEIACKLSNRVVLTSDNPRYENPEEILKEMQLGIPPEHFKRTLKITDREEAIKTAVALANPGDIILVAGKGHENYQEIKGQKFDFNDKSLLIKFLNPEI